MKILIVLPVYNEESILRENALKLFDFLKNNISDEWQIIIADNNSSDATGEIGKDLEEKFEKIKYLKIQARGKGRAIRSAWENYSADIYSFMDADLSTDLFAFPQLLDAVTRDDCDLATGSRFLPESKVKRSLFRKFLSFNYRFILNKILKIKTMDVPCGFKAVNHKIVNNILPLIVNNEWFFDTEMIFWTEEEGYRVKEIPIVWTEHKKSGRKSKVGLLKVSFSYLKEIWRLKKTYAKN